MPDTKGLQSWRPVKSKAPDVGSYEPNPCKDKQSFAKRPVSHYFVRPGTDPGTLRSTEKKTFTTEYTQMKKFVPGCGSYNPNINVISRPYCRKR